MDTDIPSVVHATATATATAHEKAADSPSIADIAQMLQSHHHEVWVAGLHALSPLILENIPAMQVFPQAFCVSSYAFLCEVVPFLWSTAGEGV